MTEEDGSMKQFYGVSRRGSLDEAVQGLYQPQFIMLFSNKDQFEDHVAAFPAFPASDASG